MKKQQMAAKESSDQPTEENVDKIREIIFGGQMRDYELRFEELETHIKQTHDRLSERLAQKIEHMEAFMRQEFDSVSSRIDKEQSNRHEQNENDQANLRDMERSIESRFADLDQQLSTESSAIRSTLEEQRAELVDLVKQTHEQLGTLLDGSSRELTEKKVAREELAAMLAEVAERLQAGPDSV